MTHFNKIEKMNIYAKEGTKIKYLGFNGYKSDIEHANKYLKKDAIYTVLKTHVKAFYTNVILKEFPDQYFNSVIFEEV